MCYQFIYYPSPNFFIKHLDIDKNHKVRYIGAVAAGVVGANWGRWGRDWTWVSGGPPTGPVPPFYARIGNMIHITAQIYFLHIGSHQKANIFSYVVVQCKSKNGCQPPSWSSVVCHPSKHMSLIYCKHCCPTLSINNFVSIANTINYFVLVFPILLWYMRYVRAY